MVWVLPVPIAISRASRSWPATPSTPLRSRCVRFMPVIAGMLKAAMIPSTATATIISINEKPEDLRFMRHPFAQRRTRERHGMALLHTGDSQFIGHTPHGLDVKPGARAKREDPERVGRGGRI